MKPISVTNSRLKNGNLFEVSTHQSFYAEEHKSTVNLVRRGLLAILGESEVYGWFLAEVNETPIIFRGNKERG